MVDRGVTFDPRQIIAALERNYVDYVLIGALAQVLRGADVVTAGVDVCPSFTPRNLDRLSRAVEELDGRVARGKRADVTEESLSRSPILRLGTAEGVLGLVGAPAGVPNGYVDLRRAATREDLGGGIRPLVASTGDLAAMAAALHRNQDLERLPMLRRIVELEVRRGPARQDAPAPSRSRRSQATRSPRTAR